MAFIVIILLFLIFTDAILLRRQAQRLFHEIFNWHNWSIPVVFLGIIFMLVLGLHEDYPKQWWLALFLAIFPFYLVKRYEFRKAWHSQDQGLTFGETKISLASETLGIILHWVAGMVLAVLAIKAVAHFFIPLQADMAQMVIMTMVSSLWMLILVNQMVKSCSKLDFPTVLGLKRNRQPWFKIWFLPFLFGLGFATLASILTVARSYQPKTPFYELLASTSSSWLMLAFFIVAVVLAPFFEEVIFRGFFFYVVNKLKGKMFAVVSIAIVFALLHYDQYWGDWLAIVAVTLLGFMLTTLRAWTGTSIASMMMHYSFNIGMTFIPLIMVFSSNPVYWEYQIRYNNLDAEQKEQFLLESIHKYPQHGASYNDLAWLYAEENMSLDEALRLVHKALEIEPGNYAFLDTKAEILYKMGDYQQALLIEESLLKRYPSDTYLEKQLEKFRRGLRDK